MPTPAASNTANKSELPPRSLEVLRDLATCDFILTQKLGLASDSICSALERRGLARRFIQDIPGSATPRQIIKISAEGRAFVRNPSN